MRARARVRACVVVYFVFDELNGSRGGCLLSIQREREREKDRERCIESFFMKKPSKCGRWLLCDPG